tara:strand:- start:78 stop:506 length:429 start_codon:yes stop_codon:yes gene_type:complete
MTRIPALLLQQFVGMSDYERDLAIDRASRELGLSIKEITSQLKEFQSGQVKPSNSHSSNGPIPSREGNFKSEASQKEGAPRFLENTHKYRFTYDPSHSGKKRQSEVDQAIVCPHCNAALGIPSVRPISVKCPVCLMESTFEN